MSTQNIDDLVAEAQRRCRQKEVLRCMELETGNKSSNASSLILARVFSVWGILNIALAVIFIIIGIVWLIEGKESPSAWIWRSVYSAGGAVLCFGIAELLYLFGKIAENAEAIKRLIETHYRNEKD